MNFLGIKVQKIMENPVKRYAYPRTDSLCVSVCWFSIFQNIYYGNLSQTKHKTLSTLLFILETSFFSDDDAMRSGDMGMVFYCIWIAFA